LGSLLAISPQLKGAIMEQNESEFYDRLNEIDNDRDYYCLAGHLICAISGSIVGFIAGYLLGWI